MSMQLFIRPDGTAQCLYNEDINLAKLGTLDIKRASHVEPDPNNPGSWYADLAPVGGPMLQGFASRAAALEAEADWLNTKMRSSHVEAL
jgi:hypothetical protein